MKSKPISLLELMCNENFEKVVKETLDDRILYREGLDSLQKSQLFSLVKGDVTVGFYSVDILSGCVEIHVYMFSPYRKYSLKALRYIFSLQHGDIKTSVYGTHLHIVHFLCKLGFTVTDVLENALVKNGKTYNVVELFFIKENTNG